MSLADQKLKEVMARVLDVEAAEITDSASNDTLELWDSLRRTFTRGLEKVGD